MRIRLNAGHAIPFPRRKPATSEPCLAARTASTESTRSSRFFRISSPLRQHRRRLGVSHVLRIQARYDSDFDLGRPLRG